MSQQNVELAKRGLEAFNRRDVNAFFELATDDFEWIGALLGRVEGGSYRGREGMERYFEDASDTWEEFRTVIEEFRDLGEHVLALGRMIGRGRGSGVEVDALVGMIVDFRDGRMSRSRAYLDQAEALRAAELAP
jgi:ketosteroid isomerase-like protein